MPLLSVRDLTLRFGAVTAFSGVSFDVAQGELFAVIGPKRAANRRRNGHEAHCAAAATTRAYPPSVPARVMRPRRGSSTLRGIGALRAG